MPGEGVTINKVKVTDKGQISIPAKLQRKMGIKKGDELLLVSRGRRMILEKPERVLAMLEDEFADVQRLTELALEELWGTKGDEVWSEYLREERP